MAEHKPSKRATQLWVRLSHWYGARLAEQYGPTPPADWCDIVDGASNETMRVVLSEIRNKHLTHPPTLPEFDALVSKAKTPTAAESGPLMQERLSDFAMRRFGPRLTAAQIRGPWTYIGKQFDAPDAAGKMRRNHGIEITGVVIPADGDAPGYRVMVEDMQIEEATA